eukprot:5742158-Lingulodinium_polyedra.AAC.1
MPFALLCDGCGQPCVWRVWNAAQRGLWALGRLCQAIAEHPGREQPACGENANTIASARKSEPSSSSFPSHRHQHK